jgi:small-conductance mechanosensitive channel
LQLFGIKFVGLTAENGHKLLVTVIFIAAVIIGGKILHALAGLIPRGAKAKRFEFWARQVIHLVVAGILILGLLSIWFDDPNRLATAAGLFTAGLAFALQRVITSIAAYFVLLRGKSFNVGDRITMGGVRGDVIALDFIQTTIMEMGEPPGEQADAPAMWVHARQYTGRIVTLTNDKIFDQPVYNYSREFPFIWEEMQLPISYKDKRDKAEQILLEVADRHAVKTAEISEDALKELERRYFIVRADLKPRVFWRLTDNWIELTVRFVCKTHGVRDVKDRMSREILQALDENGIGIASGTYEIVGFPPVKIESWPNAPDDGRQTQN